LLDKIPQLLSRPRIKIKKTELLVMINLSSQPLEEIKKMLIKKNLLNKKKQENIFQK